LVHQGLGETVAGDIGNTGDVVDRFLRIELGTLAADLVEDVDQVRLDVEQPQLEHRKQSTRTCADNQRIGFDHFGHRLRPRSQTPVVPENHRADYKFAGVV